METEELFLTALEYEKKIFALYEEAAETIDDERGKAIFRGLAGDEQSHIEFLKYSLEQLRNSESIDIRKLQTQIPTKKQIEAEVEDLKAQIPQKMLGNIKTVLNSALKMEIETSAFYRQACSKTEGEVRSIMEKFLAIEERHLEAVQIELDHALNSGIWFNFMEVDMED